MTETSPPAEAREWVKKSGTDLTAKTNEEEYTPLDDSDAHLRSVL